MSERFDNGIVQIDVELDDEQKSDSTSDDADSEPDKSLDASHKTTNSDVDDILRAKDELLKAAGNLTGKLGNFALKKGDEFFEKINQPVKKTEEHHATFSKSETTVYEHQSEGKSHRSGKTYKIKTTHSSSNVMPNEGEIDARPNNSKNANRRRAVKASNKDSHNRIGCGSIMAIAFLILVILFNLPKHQSNDKNLSDIDTGENVSVEMQEEERTEEAAPEETKENVDEAVTDAESEKEPAKKEEEVTSDDNEHVVETEKSSEKEDADTEPKESYKLTLKINYSYAGLFASYDIDVFVDDKKVGTVSPENELLEKTKIEEGKHTIKFSESDSDVIEESTEIKLEGNRIYSCDLESHFTSIDIENEHLEKKKDRETRLAEEKATKAKEQKKKAVQKAKSYLEYTAFSKKGLKEQLIYEGFTEDEAKYGVKHCGADWNEQALKKAKSYLEFTAFSKKGLKEQLIYDGFTEDEAKYGVKHCEANWKEQALKQAKQYLSYSDFSKQELKEQLIYEGFTEDEAKYAVKKAF